MEHGIIQERSEHPNSSFQHECVKNIVLQSFFHLYFSFTMFIEEDNWVAGLWLLSTSTLCRDKRRHHLILFFHSWKCNFFFFFTQTYIEHNLFMQLQQVSVILSLDWPHLLKGGSVASGPSLKESMWCALSLSYSI